MLNVALISGSARIASQSLKVAQYLQQRLIELSITSDEQSSLIDLGQQPLPMWPDENQGPWAQHQAKLTAADAVVVVVPEWNGMACPAIKNFFIYASAAELGHKPALLVSVSSGIGGVYPISELRASSYKNCRVNYLPEHLIVRNVGSVLNTGESASEDDQRIRQRADYALEVLNQYAQALKPVRLKLDQSRFATGM